LDGNGRANKQDDDQNSQFETVAYFSSVDSSPSSTSWRIASKRRVTPPRLAQARYPREKIFGNRTAESGPISGRRLPRILWGLHSAGNRPQNLSARVCINSRKYPSMHGSKVSLSRRIGLRIICRLGPNFATRASLSGPSAFRPRPRRSGFVSDNVADCVCRSVTIASGRPYAEIYDALARVNETQRRSKGASRRHS
jgi:hypothetical protein